ncbi:phosphoribosyltransferase [Acinetobacter puyangensis]|uniref:phosphoribosyltransferase n=1 Tax=Acinetobacter puyangensis TaxID=1096779 RepID=UPI003A4E2298
MTNKFVRTPWGDFPKVKVLYPSGTLKKASEKLYLEAKGGNVLSAYELLTTHVLTNDDILDIGVLLFKLNPILAPVLAQEHLGKNRIPAIFAEILSGHLGFDICDDIVQTVKANHTNASAYERIVRQPMFDGYVEQGRNYVILDDTVAMGGTLAALKGHIESNGGKVILAVTLTGYSDIDLVPLEKTLNYVRNKHPELSEWWKNEFGFPIEYLTQGELGHFKKPNSLDEIRSRLIEAGLQSSDERG